MRNDVSLSDFSVDNLTIVCISWTQPKKSSSRMSIFLCIAPDRKMSPVMLYTHGLSQLLDVHGSLDDGNALTNPKKLNTQYLLSMYYMLFITGLSLICY